MLPKLMKTRAALLLAAALWGASAQAQGICGRSAEVQAYILGWTYPKLDCADVTAAHLAAITAIAPKKAFPRLRAGDLAGLTNVSQLELRSKSLTELPAGIFDDLVNLKQMWLKLGTPSKLPDSVFDKLTNLDFMDLTLSELPDGAFDNLSNLRSLFVSGISTKLPDGVFDKLSNLSFLWFGDNTLTELPDRVFDGLTNLTDMYLAGNGFTKLPDGVFDKLANLDGLNLRENALTELPDGVFDKLTGLSGLVVHSNPLTELPEGVFDGLTNLESLNLDLYESSRSPRQSPMTELPDGVFDDLVNLKRLFLRSGALTKLPEGVFDNLANLAWLDAALYNLTELPEGVFRKLTSMRKLEFYGGAMTELPEGIFARNAGAVDLQELSFRYGDSASDVDMTPQFVRTDAGNFAPGPASVVFSLPQGAPRTLTWALSVKGASLFADTVTVPAGATISAPFTLTRNEDHIGHVRLRAEKTWNFGGVRGIWFPQDDPEIRLFPRADMPQNLGVAAADRSLTAVWNRPADDKRVLGYTVRWKLATAENFATDNTYTTKIQWPRETSYTIEGLQNGLTYDVEVAARIYALRGSWGGRLEFSDFVKAQGVPGKSRFRLNVLGGDSPSARDGTAIMRYLLGVRGKSLLAGLANGQPRVVELKIAEAAKNGELDVDRSGQVDSTDGALIVRYLLGLRNDALVADLKVASEAKDIAKNIEELKPASAS